jgi:hypothetical protein
MQEPNITASPIDFYIAPMRLSLARQLREPARNATQLFGWERFTETGEADDIGEPTVKQSAPGGPVEKRQRFLRPTRGRRNRCGVVSKRPAVTGQRPYTG